MAELRDGEEVDVEVPKHYTVSLVVHVVSSISTIE